MFGNHKDSSTGGMLMAGAAGLVAGLLVNPARKLAVQGPTMMKGEWDEALAAEHEATLAVIDLIEQTDESDTGRRKLHLAQLKHMIGKHAFQEENTIYPMMRKHGLADASRDLNEEHAEVKRLLFELTEMPEDDPQWIAKIRELRSDLEEHMREEEDELFPQLRRKLDDKANADLSKAMNKEGLKLA